MVVVTDLDATLLTSEYSWKEAESAISRLQHLNFPLVFNSSKTAAEMKDLSEEMRNFSPMIAENGDGETMSEITATEVQEARENVVSAHQPQEIPMAVGQPVVVCRVLQGQQRQLAM